MLFRSGRDPHGRAGDGHVLPEAAHVAHVLPIFVAVRAVIRHVHRMNHRARAQKEQRLEERVRHQMEDARAVRSDPDTDEHVAKLRHGGVGEDRKSVV